MDNNYRKLKGGLVATLVAMATMLFLYGCSLTPPKAKTYADRVKYFEQDLNNGGSAGDLQNDFWSGMVDYAGDIQDQAWWNSTPFAAANGPFTFSYSIDNGTTYTYTVTNHVNPGGKTVLFTFTNPTGDNVLIKSLDYDGGNITLN